MAKKKKKVGLLICVCEVTVIKQLLNTQPFVALFLSATYLYLKKVFVSEQIATGCAAMNHVTAYDGDATVPPALSEPTNHCPTASAQPHK